MQHLTLGIASGGLRQINRTFLWTGMHTRVICAHPPQLSSQLSVSYYHSFSGQGRHC